MSKAWWAAACNGSAVATTGGSLRPLSLLSWKVWQLWRQRLAPRGLMWRGRCVCVCLSVFGNNQRGASLIEYSFLVALITAIVVVAVSVAGAWAQGMWSHLLPLLG